MNKESKAIRVLKIVCLIYLLASIAFIVVVVLNSNGRKISLFDLAYTACCENNKDEFSKNMKIIFKDDSKSVVEGFAMAYSDKYSDVQFANKYIEMYMYAKENNLIDGEAYGIVLNYVIENIMDEADYKDLIGVEGYYTDNPNADPQPTERTVSGDFNNQYDGNSIYSSSRTNTVTCEYFGDFAMAIEEGSRYDGGRYEWVDGKFYDEPAHWVSFTDYELFYKGESVGERFYICTLEKDEYYVFFMESGFESDDYISVAVIKR